MSSTRVATADVSSGATQPDCGLKTSCWEGDFVAGARLEPLFFGEPRALAYLAFTEAWERFSYYGMTSILVLYMTHALLPGGEAKVAGLVGIRTALDQLFGPTTALGFASRIFGFYTGFVYFTPIAGGWIADRFTGRGPAIVAGALLMSAGHIAMAFTGSFLLALVLLIVGCGFLKGNISAQVGDLYPPDDAGGRTRAFAIFSIGINVGAIAGPLGVGLLAECYGWHVGFALAGVLMLAGLFTYLAGYRFMPIKDRLESAALAAAPLTRTERRAVVALFVVMMISVFQSIAYYQNSNIALIWTERYVDLSVLGFHVPVAWFVSVDPAASILFVPPLFAFWRRRAAAGQHVSEIRRITQGAWIAAVANLLLVFACWHGGRASILIPFTYDVMLGIGFLYYWPTLLALVSRAAPGRFTSTMMGAAFLSLFLANILIGLIGAYYDRMSPIAFWALQAGIAVTGALLATGLRPMLEPMLPNDGPEAGAH